MKFHGISLLLIFTVLWLPAASIAGDVAQSPATQGTQPQSGSPASKEKTAKKPNQDDVKSRGLFKKKKKKQKGGSAAHSQPSEKTDSPTQ
jgi:hypothetical protein